MQEASEAPECGIALAWADAGVPVFPIAIIWNEEKQATDKRPLTKNGHLDASRDPARVQQLFTSHTPLRAGEVLAVGGRPGPAGYVVLDPDRKNGKDGVAHLDLVMGITRQVFIVDTASGGEHHWFKKRHPSTHIGNVTTWADHGIDVRADDGWVVLPGVTTPWGNWTARPDVPFRDTPTVPEGLWQELVTASPRNGSSGSTAWSRYQPDKHEHLLHPATVAMWTLIKDRYDFTNGDPKDHADNYATFRPAQGDAEAYLEITRPGKSKKGISATLGSPKVGPGVLKVFTSGWPGLEEGGRYDQWDLDPAHGRFDPPETPNTPDSDSTEGATGGSGGSGGVKAPAYFVQPTPSADLPEDAKRVLVGTLATEIDTSWGVPALLTMATAVGVAASATRGQVRAVLPTGSAFPVGLYQAALAAPGMLKSPVLALLSRPLLELQSQHAKEAGPGVAVTKSKMEALRTAVKNKTTELSTAYSKNLDPDAAAIELEYLTRELGKIEDSTANLPGLQVIAAGADLTYEALIRRAADNGGKVALLSAEGGLMENLAGRYSEGSARTEFLNSAYDGEAYSGERVSDSARVIPEPWANLLLVVQPDVLGSMLASDHMRRRGFLQRFWMFNIPTGDYRNRHDLPWIDLDLQERWKSALERIWRAATTNVGTIEVMCGDEAEPLRVIERDLIRPEFQHAQAAGNYLLSGWLAKAAMTSVRLGTILELLQRDNLKDQLQIGPTAAAAAAAITEQAVIHAKYLLAEGRSAAERSPRFRVLAWLLGHADSSGGSGGVEVSTRDAWQRFRDQKWCQRTEDAKAVLTDLASLGWIDGPQQRTSEHGGRPTELWRLHPEAHHHFAAMTGVRL